MPRKYDLITELYRRTLGDITKDAAHWQRFLECAAFQYKYSFNDYLLSRVSTSCLMLIITAIYMVRGIVLLEYSLYKTAVILLMSLLKLTDAVEDVYHGRLQQKGRLDIGAKCMALRYIGVLLIMAIMLIISHNLIISMLITLIFSWAFFLWTFQLFSVHLEKEEKESLKSSKQVALFKECFPIAAGGFLMIYIANAPKYAIDANMNEMVQATFNYIFMPVYVINTLSTFIFQPMISKMALSLELGNMTHFLTSFFRQIAVIFAICVGVIVGGFLLGIPVLSVLYNMNLRDNKYAFMVLLFGGCLLAFASFFAVCITILRKQKWLLIGYIIPAAVEMFGANTIVYNYGLEGAAWMYTLLVAVQMIIFITIFVLSYSHIAREFGNLQNVRG